MYDRRKAPKLWNYLVDAGAKKYAKDFGGTWNKMFPKPERAELSRQAARAFEVEHPEVLRARDIVPKKTRKKKAPTWENMLGPLPKKL